MAYGFDETLPAALRQGCLVTLFFAETGTVISAFLSCVIGQLYGEFSEAQVDALVKVQGLPTGAEGTVETTRRWAKAYYRDPAGYLKALQDILEE